MLCLLEEEGWRNLRRVSRASSLAPEWRFAFAAIPATKTVCGEWLKEKRDLVTAGRWANCGTRCVAFPVTASGL